MQQNSNRPRRRRRIRRVEPRYTIAGLAEVVLVRRQDAARMLLGVKAGDPFAMRAWPALADVAERWRGRRCCVCCEWLHRAPAVYLLILPQDGGVGLLVCADCGWLRDADLAIIAEDRLIAAWPGTRRIDAANVMAEGGSA